MPKNIISEFQRNKTMSDLKVSDVMMTDFKTIDGMTSIAEALTMLKNNRLNALFVSPKDKNNVYGIMTLKDIARKVISQRRKLHETHVYEIMSKPVLTIQTTMPIPYAARFLSNFNVSYAMVLEKDEVVGMISLNGMVMQWKGE
tara:strand:+ start:1905 stop:2336 length:432 start_codon:yes stop_codon:yes gene_type:complete